MKLSRVAQLIKGVVICGDHRLDEEVKYAFASDMMSDVLTIKDGNFLLVTGLANPQSMRTAEMADVQFIVLARGKQITPDMIDIANDSDMLVMCTAMSVFRVSGILYQAGLSPVY